MADTPQDDRQRPLSPHLQVYRPQMTSVLSILHRLCGAALAAGLLIVAGWLIAAAMGEGPYYLAMGLAQTKLGTLALFGWSVALFYHMCNGVRHLIWDTGRLFKLEHAYLGGYFVLGTTVLLTFLVWCPCFYGGGGS